MLVSTMCYLQLCINGECTGSICLEWNLTECFLTSSIIPNIDKRKLCELACQNGTDASTCRGTSEFAHMVGLPEGGMSLRPGSPCDNFQVKYYRHRIFFFYKDSREVECKSILCINYWLISVYKKFWFFFIFRDIAMFSWNAELSIRKVRLRGWRICCSTKKLYHR